MTDCINPPEDIIQIRSRREITLSELGDRKCGFLDVKTHDLVTCPVKFVDDVSTEESGAPRYKDALAFHGLTALSRPSTGKTSHASVLALPQLGRAPSDPIGRGYRGARIGGASLLSSRLHPK